jgi:hypothetical protein
VAHTEPEGGSHLARFMRESVNVPYSFALFEQGGRNRLRRVNLAAVVLKEAARDLVHWSDPPVHSASARDVFYTYARNLERHVGILEVATQNHDTERSARSLEEIRRTCNGCHHFFRPASLFSRDVAVGLLAIDVGADL